MDKEKLLQILDEHRKWRNGEGGRRADLTGADLMGADLMGAYLTGADLRRAYLTGADLTGADLKDTIYDGVNWILLLGIVPDKDGNARAYKIINSHGEGIYQGGINYLKRDKFSAPKVDKDLNVQCSYGINLATLAWCLTERQEDYRLLLMEFAFKDAVCPIGSDGKFRVKRCVKIGECNWKGELTE